MVRWPRFPLDHQDNQVLIIVQSENIMVSRWENQ